MELRHLRYFVAVAEAENVSRAALKLHVSQPALSRQVRDLEEELNVKLFERSAKSLRLTEAGRLFLNESRAVLSRAEQAVTVIRAAASKSEGELHLGYAPSPSAKLLPMALRRFQALLPKVRVKLHDLSTEEMLTGVRERKLDLAILVRPAKALLRQLRFEPLITDPVRLAVSPQHPLSRRRTVSISDTAMESLVAFSRTEYPEYHEYLRPLLEKLKKPPRIVEEHESVTSLVAAVEAGVGIAVVPQSLACTAGNRLKILPLVPEPPPICVGLLWSQQGLSAWGEAFAKAAREAAVSQ